MQNTYLKNRNIINNFLNLKKKRILITGATGNLGEYLSINFAKLNCDLILTDNNNKKLKTLKKKLKKHKVKIEYKSCDLKNEIDIKNFCFWLKKFSKIDTLINNAAYVGTSNFKNWNVEFLKQSPDNWSDVFKVNLTSIFSITQKISNKLSKSKYPSVINISSVYSVIPPKLDLYKGTTINNPASYSVSKAGLNYLTRWLAVNLANKKIRVNSISPGGIDSGQEKKFLKKYISKTLLRRMTTKKDIFKCCLFLSSNMSDYITGQNIIVDGGFSIK